MKVWRSDLAPCFLPQITLLVLVWCLMDQEYLKQLPRAASKKSLAVVWDGVY